MSTLAISCGLGRAVVASLVPPILSLLLPVVTGDGTEQTDLSADGTDTWTYDGTIATVLERQYRLLLNGVVVPGPQDLASVVVPVNSGGQTYSYQLRVLIAQADGQFSSWIEIANGVVVGLSSVPDAFGTNDWTVSNGLTAGEIEIVVSGLPFNGGSDLSHIEYNINGGGFISLGGATTGSYLITGFDAGQVVSVQLRAVNDVGPGGISDEKIITFADVPAAMTLTDWDLFDLETGSAARLTINMLPLSPGASVTQLEHNIDDQGWVIFSTTPNVGDYELTGLLVEDVQASIVIRASNAIGHADDSDIKTITPTAGFQLLGTADGEVEINGATGMVTFTITGSESYATYDVGNGPGVFEAQTSDLNAGPINLVPPRLPDVEDMISGTVLSVVPGLWVYDGGNAEPTMTYRWVQDTGPIAGATGSSYVLSAQDIGRAIWVEETATDAKGARQALSNTLSGTNAINTFTATTAGLVIDYSGMLSLNATTAGIKLETL